MQVSRAEVIAFRLQAQHLSQRLGEHALLDVAAACGVQNSPPGSGLLALHARVLNLTTQRVDEAVAEAKNLTQSWCMRGSPFYFPTVDAPVFTTGVLPPTEEALRQFILGAGPAVDKLGLSLSEAVDLTDAEIRDVLTGRQLAIEALGVELAERIACKLTKPQRDSWEEAGPHAPGQPLGEAIVHFCVRILTLRGVVCFAPRDGNKAPFVLVDEWLGEPFPDVEPQAARAELLRRYLRCYGPSTRADFAAWLGVRSGDAEPWWSLLAAEMTPVDFGGKTWLLTADLDVLRSAPASEEVRLLPPHDPYTQLRDRDTIVDKQYHRQVWKSVGDPGTVLVDGEIRGIWRPRKQGPKLAINIQTFEPLAAAAKQLLEAEAEQVASLRGAGSVDVSFDTF